MWKQSNVGGWTERTASPKASGPEPRPVQSRVGVGTLLQGTRRLWPSSRAGLQQDAAGGGGRSGPDVGLALAGTKTSPSEGEKALLVCRVRWPL